MIPLLKQGRETTLVGKPAPEEKIRELASAIARIRPEIPVGSFLLPRDESCNFQWNTVSTRSFAVLLEWYLHENSLLNEDSRSQEAVLLEFLDGIVNSPRHTVVVDGESVPVSLNYLRRTDNWISNYTAVSILEAVSRHLGTEYADLEIALSPDNPWLAITRYALERSAEGIGLVQRLQALKGGPRAVYLDVPITTAFFHRGALYEVISDLPLGARRRRVIYLRHLTNYYYEPVEEVGFEAAYFRIIPQLFSQHPLLRRVPGFNLGLAEVGMEFPQGDYDGTWEITIDYDITPIDRIRSWFSIGELQETVATLSAEVLELQRDRKALTEEAERLAGRLVEEEKARRVYQVRAAQADAVARFLHQTSNLVLQPLASTMIVFEDFIEIIEDCRNEWGKDRSEEELFHELDESLARVQEVYPSASRVIEGYRELFSAFYEVYVSTKPERDVNQDLRYIETLVRNKYILTEVKLDLELDSTVPSMRLEGGVQSIFLELLHNAARYGAGRLLVKTAHDPQARLVQIYFYNDGEPIPEDEWDRVLSQDVSRDGQGFGLADARYIIETLNGGCLRLVSSDREGFSVLFVIDLKMREHDGIIGQRRNEHDK